MSKYPFVESPIRLGPVEIKNRFYFAPHGLPYAVGTSPSDLYAKYFAARAAGGCGLIIQPTSTIAGRRRGTSTTPYLEESLASFQAMADTVHGEGAKLFAEIHYAAIGNSWGYEPYSAAAPILAASGVGMADDFHVMHEMSVDTIKKVVEGHKISSRNLARAGFDGVELHCAHGMLCETFLSPYFNRRSDHYGGSLENRMRFLVECLQAAREGIGPDRAVGVRMNADELVPEAGGLTQSDIREVISRLIDMKLIDYIDLDIALEPDQIHLGMPNYLLPTELYRSYVEGVRSAAGDVPVLSVLGQVNSISQAEEALKAGVVDMVGVARGLMAEPDLLVQALEGREEDSRRCLYCNLCMTDGERGFAGCAINPETAHERQWRTYEPAARSAKVVIVGAGPAGLEAARVADRLGHSVVVFEQQDRVGGQLNLWASLPDRERFAGTVQWFERQLKKSAVELRTGVVATADMVMAENPDAVLVATGSRYLRNGETGFYKAPVPGWEHDFVYTPEDVLEDNLRFAGRVIVFDDESITTAPGIAELLAANASAVTVVTRWRNPFHRMGSQLATTQVPRLKKMGVELATSTFLRRIGDHDVTVYDIDTDEDRQIDDVEAVIMVAGRRADLSLGKALEGRAQQVFSIGDALSPRGLSEAIQEGHRYARLIGEKGAPRNFTDLYFSLPLSDMLQRPASILLDAKTQPKPSQSTV